MVVGNDCNGEDELYTTMNISKPLMELDRTQDKGKSLTKYKCFVIIFVTHK